MTTQLDDPTPTDSTAAGYIAVKVSTHPDNYTPGIRALAKAYESQRERIADLEDDVERLRPKERFTPETLFEFDSGNTHVLIDTDSGGGVCIDTTDYVTKDNVVTMLTAEQSTQLTTALNKWAGVDGVEWRSIDDPPKDGAEIMVTTGTNIDNGLWEDGEIRGSYIRKPTHWAPLPKPPVQS